MAYTPHVLFAFGGSWVTDPSEVWECTVRLRADGGGGDTLNCAAYLTATATQMSSWFHASENYISTEATLRWIKANHIGADGTYVDKTTTNVYDYAVPSTGGVLQGGAPGFCSLAYTWETANARGPGHRGRIYPLNNVFNPLGAFKVSNAMASANAVAAVMLLNALRASSGAGLTATPVIASKINGAIVDIVGATSDNIYDVQRRRKNRIVGTRSGLAVPGARP